MTYLALEEDSMNNGSYGGSRWFRIGEFRENLNKKHKNLNKG